MDDDVRYLARVKLPKFDACLERLLARVGRPVLLGEVSLEAACSLQHAEREMDALCAVGRFRRLELDELRARGWHATALAYAPRG